LVAKALLVGQVPESVAAAPGAVAVGAVTVGAVTVGAVTVGAVTVGAVTVGAVAAAAGPAALVVPQATADSRTAAAAQPTAKADLVM
jgi:hypothetical protein